MELGDERLNPEEEDNQMMEKKNRHSHKKDLKSLVKSCVKGSNHRSTKR